MRSMIKAWVPVTVMCGLGSVAALAGCQFPVPADVCVASEATCADGMLTVCGADGRPGAPTACTFGCAPGGEGSCADLAPSNGLGMYLDQARAAAPLVLTGDAVVDTDTGKVTVNGQVVAAQTAIVPAAPVEILVVIARSFEANNVTARGRRALAIVSDGDVTLHGTLSVAARDGQPGAGASLANDSVCTARPATPGTTGTGGASGGGYGTAGGRGGNGGDSMGGPEGAVVGNERIEPLRGGCPGAYAYGVPVAGHPGAAGGALQVSSRGAIVLSPAAKVVASGGGAKGPTECSPICPNCAVPAGDPPSCEPGSGGGAGGGILLEAASLAMPASASITANGGAGHCSSVGTSLDGTTTESAAAGTVCSPATGIGNGGDGGAGTSAGFAGTSSIPYGGGGGGGAGRIRINLPPGTSFDPGPPVVSPVPSIGSTLAR